MPKMDPKRTLRRAVLVKGARTPFVKSFGELYKTDSIGLGVSAVEGLLNKTKLDPQHVDNIIWGNVVLQTTAPNIAREIVIDLNLPKHIVGHSTSMACSSGMNAIAQATMMVEGGHADCVIAGGSDSLSCAELPLPRDTAHGLAMSFVYAPKKWSPVQRIKNFGKLASWNPAKWAPKPPAVAERSTGKTMGYHADLMAELNKVTREEQEAFALRSHNNSKAARDKGHLAEEIFPTKQGDKTVTADNLIMEDTASMEKKMPSLKTAFRKGEGATVTPATSSALTDGGSCMLVMSEEKALALGYPIDCTLKSWDFAAIDPYPQLLMAPALAIPRALQKAGLSSEDIDVWEIHEAFSAQVLSTLKAVESEEFCQRFLNMPALKPINRELVNPNGGSIAIGHPFAATGGRVLTAAMNELRRSKKQHSLVSICAAGGLGTVAIVERDASKA
eukprot:TRINITY_DN2876_c1_g1_i1.p2 TRINITY_DN2876_c1_g1~~TRINITY_DN2876_c1_g1_i1.p2  ORF type:complete len:446 (+),score=197.11 TRINITY_DN2876_c1_g1_i1:128-1465(+)